MKLLSRVRLFGTQWTVTCQALCPWEFSRQEYQSGLPCFPPGDLPNSVVSDSLRPHRLYSPWNSPGQNTGVGTFPFSRRSSQPEYWSGLPCLPPGDHPNPGIELASHVLAGRLFTTAPPGKPQYHLNVKSKIGHRRTYL